MKQVPEWWITSNEGVKSYLENKVKTGKVAVIGHSAGGRELLSYSYGEKETLPQTVTFSSAYAAHKPELYTRAAERSKLSLFIYGAIHGGEVEGTAGMMNLINILEYGVDLRGKAWPKVQEYAEKYRFVFVPLSQPDGRARMKLDALCGESLDTFQYYMHGIWKDGRPCKYPYHKEVQPLPVAEMKQLGAYFNDNGVNCQHDDFFGQVQPETQALVDLVHDERPDCILSCHSCEADPGFGGPNISQGAAGKKMVTEIAAAVLARHVKEDLRPYRRLNIDTHTFFLLQDILYLASGGLPLLYEFPLGCENVPFTLEEIVELGLCLFEEIMRFGVETRFMPRF